MHKNNHPLIIEIEPTNRKPLHQARSEYDFAVLLDVGEAPGWIRYLNAHAI
jgi:hypothetical protein